VQVHGGMGFVEEGGAAQFYRDARIAPIYEGANGIQAIDLYGRKLMGDRGQAMLALVADARGAAKAIDGKGVRLAAAADALEEATSFMLNAPRQDALAGATPYLDLAGDVAGGMLLAQGLKRASSRSPAEKAQLDAQAALFKYFSETTLARAPSRLAVIKVGAGALAEAALI
jgi:hypothetical protein